MNAGSVIAITGVGSVTALGTSVEELYRRLCAGERGIGPIRGFSSEGCRVTIAAEAPTPAVPPGSGAVRGFRTARLALHAARVALEQAGLGVQTGARGRAAPTAAVRLDEVALVVGTTGSGDAALEASLVRRAGGEAGITARARLRRYPKRALVDHLGAALRLGGPRATINTACSSGAVALLHAADLVRSGLCAAALAGGADELTRYTLSGFAALRAVDPEPCRPFDRGRRGMTLGEGAGFLLLERADAARDRGAVPLGYLLGGGHSCDAGHLTAPDADGAGAARAVRLALADAGMTGNEVGFVNAHGTGTPHNDAAEVAALITGLGSSAARCPIHTVKASIGHTLGAAGAIEAIVALRSLAGGFVPPTAGLVDPEAGDRLDFVMGAPRATRARVALSCSFGFGGNNAALVLARPEEGAPCWR